MLSCSKQSSALFPKIDFQNFNVSCSQKLVSLPFFLKIFANVSLFPVNNGYVPFSPKLLRMPP